MRDDANEPLLSVSKSSGLTSVLALELRAAGSRPAIPDLAAEIVSLRARLDALESRAFAVTGPESDKGLTIFLILNLNLNIEY